MAAQTQILIADDHPFVRLQMRRLINNRSGWRVCAEASDGTEAVAAAQRHCPDVAVLDVYMPVMSGFEAARKIAAICPCTLVLVESLEDFRPFGAFVGYVGVRGYVQKDRIPRDLIPAIESALKGEEDTADSTKA